MIKQYIIALVLLSTYCSIAQQTGSIVGKVTDKEINDEPLPFANVTIKGTSKGTTTNMDGLYSFEELAPGNYTIEFSFVGYEPVTVNDVEVVEGKVTEVNTGLGASVANLDEVVITTVARKDSEVALLLDQRKAVNIKESIGSQELAKLGVSDAAVATTKISGISNSEGSGDIYIRGLGDRYLVTTYNGLPIPSDNVMRKNIDLSLFPTRVVQNISVSKAYTADNYGDQASGSVNIRSRELVGKEEYSLGIKSGINSEAIDVNEFQVGVYEEDITLGFYNRELSNLDAITQQSWNSENVDSPINNSFNFTLGKKFGDNFRTLLTASQKTDFEYRFGTFQEFDNNNFRDRFTDVERFRKTVTTSALLDLKYLYGENNNVEFNSLFINKLQGNVFQAGTNGEGFVFDEVQTEPPLSQFIRDQNIRNTQLWVNQLMGDNNFGDHNLNWALGYNIVDADEPNRVRNEINFNENRIELGRTGGFQQRKSEQLLEDYEINATINDQIKLTNVDEEDNDNGLSVNIGGDYRFKERDFESQFIGVQETSLNNVNPPSLDNLSAVFTQQNVDEGDLTIQERPTDFYDATLSVMAGYAVANYKLDEWNFNLGLRYERDEIETNWDVSNFPGRTGTAEKDYDNFLPSLNVKYEISDDQNVRLSASKTITLPEFIEISPFQYVSPNGQVTQGNPDVEASENYNLDLKWELFPTDGELVSLTGFYKQINDPINRVLERSAAGIFSYFNSGERAEVYGLELETKLDVIKESRELGFTSNFGFNATRMWHSQDLKRDFDEINGNQELIQTFRYNGKKETGLQGASDWIFNGNLTVETSQEHPYLFNVSANFASDKIFSLGNPKNQEQTDTFFNEEIIEEGFVILNAIVQKDINENFSVRLSGKNLLNPLIERTQFIDPLNDTEPARREVVRSYTRGREISLGVNYKF
jgi:outer membrane receptor protein involved in Fe transport